MRIKSIVLISALTILLLSCSYHIGSISGGSAVITDSAASQVRLAYGSSKTTHVLGIGGNQKDALVLEAKRNLYLNNKLEKHQAYGQTTVDFKRSIFFPIITTTVTVSADILDFSNKTNSVNIQIQEGFYEDSKFKPGSQVMYYNYNKGDSTIARVLDHDKYNATRKKYIIQYIDKRNTLKIRNVSSKDLRPISDEAPPEQSKE